MRYGLTIGGALAAILLFANGVAAQDRSEGADPAVGVAVESPSSSVLGRVEEGTGSASSAIVEPRGEENDDLVTMALATFGVAVVAAVVGLVAYLVRVRLGLVAPPPPPPEKGHGSH